MFKTSCFSRAGIVALMVIFFAESGQAQMQTLITDHFRVHFMPGAEGTARRVAETCEEVFPTLAAAYNYYDDFRTIHVLVLDTSDQLGNGWADYYSNTMAVWATNLDMELRGTHDWIKNVVTHELNHIITLNMARKKWPFQYAVLSVSRFDSNPDISFQFPLYHMNVPRGWAEGIAQYGARKFGYDRWDSHRDMLLRMAVLEDDLLSWEEMGSVSARSGKYYGELVYNQGYAMLLYVEDQYGADKVDALTHHVGSVSFDPSIERVLGVTLDQFYNGWVAYLRENYGRLQSEIRSSGFFEGEELSNLNKGIIEYHARYSPDGSKLAYISSDKMDYAIPFLKIHDMETGETYKSKDNIDSRIDWSPDGQRIVYARAKGGYNDLYIYDVERDEERRISANLRSKDPAFSPDGERIAYVHNEDGTNNLALINSDGTERVYLTNNNDGTQYYGPRFSPDGEWILFSVFRGEDRDIAVLRADSPPRPERFERSSDAMAKVNEDSVATEEQVDVFPDSVAFAHLDSSGFRALVNSPSDERDPYWLPDGSGFVFSSDQSGVFNIYKYDMENGEVEQLTNVVGGAFAPTVSVEGEVVYSSYHSNNYDLYRFDMGDFARSAVFDPLALRDYRSVYDGPKLSEQFKMGRYRGRNVVRYVPLLQVGPTFVGNTFGLNQASAGLQFSSGDMMGGQQVTAWGIVGKNMRDATDLNTDLGFFYERSMQPRVGNSRTFNPSFYVAGRRREIDNLVKSSTLAADTLSATNVYPIPVDSTTNLLLPNVEQYVYEGSNRQDLFKTVMKQLVVGVDMPLTRRQQLSATYMFRNYAESWTLRHFRNQTQVYLVQDGVDISQAVDAELLGQDTTLVSQDAPLNFYNEIDFYSAHTMSVGWNYRKINPTAYSPTGRGVSLVYRYSMPTLADSLAQPTPTDGMPSDQFVRVPRRFRVNEYVGAYSERLGLPFDNVLSLEAVAAYRNVVLKPSFIEDGGFFEGRFYWPLRYYLGGQNFLSGYPYFTASGSKLVYSKISYGFPVFKRLNRRFLNFTFTKLNAEVFAEAGAVGNFRSLSDAKFNKGKFLTGVGGELRLQLFTFYRIPMTAYFQAAHPLNRDRVADTVGKIDSWRYYFGFGL